MSLSALPVLPSGSALAMMFVVVFAASIVQASLGMGYGLTAAPLLALIDPVFVPVPTILVGMITSALGAYSERDSINWPEVKVVSSGRLAGVTGAVLVLHFVNDSSVFKLVFGIGIALAVALSLLDFRVRKTQSSLVSMGTVSGLMGTITGVGAPPLALIYQYSHAGSARPTLAAIFAVGCFVSLVGLALIGWFGITELMICVMMLPSMVLGTYSGRRLGARLHSRYRFALLSIAGVASFLLIVSGTTGVVTRLL